LGHTEARPNYLAITDKLGFKIPLIWCLSAALVGIVLFQPIEAIAVSVLSLVLVWVGFKAVGFFLSFQQQSGPITNRTYDRVLKFVWFSSALGMSATVLFAMAQESKFALFFYVVSSIVFFGFALAAARRWGCYYTEQ